MVKLDMQMGGWEEKGEGWSWQGMLSEWAYTHAKKCQLILERWGQLKAYSLILNRGRSQNVQDLNFLHIFVALH